MGEPGTGRSGRRAENSRALCAPCLSSRLPPGQRLAPPDAEDIEAIIDAAFWASLRREEGYVPKISLALLPPDAGGQRR